MNHIVKGGALVSFALITSGCALFDRQQDQSDKLLNPARIHTAHDTTSKAYAASTIPKEDYYHALQLARTTYSTTSDDVATNVSTSTRNYIENYVNEGIGVVDTYCRRWFQDLDDLQRLLAYQTKNVNIISQLGTTLLGVGSANSVVVTSYGALNTAFAGATDNFDKAFLVAPTTSKVRDQIEVLMKQEAGSLKEASHSMSFKEAYKRLEGYADLCTYSRAKQIVDGSLDKTKVKLDANLQIVTESK